MSMSPEEILDIATKLGLLSNDTPRKGKTEEKPAPAPRKKPTKPVEIKEPEAQRTFGQSKAIRTLLGFYAPFNMTKGTASVLIDEASKAVVAGKDSIVIDDALESTLILLEDEYVNLWRASGFKLRGFWQPPKKPAKSEEQQPKKSELEEQLIQTLKDVEEFIPSASGYANSGLYAAQDELLDALSKSKSLNTLVWALIFQIRKHSSEE